MIRSIIDFLRRPESLKSIPLSNTDVQGTILATFDVPNDVLPQMKRDKIVGFKNFRADVNLHIRVNSNPMACGKLLVGYYASNMFNRGNASFLSNTSSILKSLTAMSACPCVEVDLASGESVNFVIPYVNVTSHWDMTQIDPSDEDLTDYPRTLTVFVLAYTDISVPSGVASLQLFVGLDNVDLSFPTFPTRELLGTQTVFKEKLLSLGVNEEQATKLSKAVKRDFKLEQQSNLYLEQQGIVSTVAGIVGSVAGAATPITRNIPILGSLVDIAGSVAKPVQEVASALGFSKNLENQTPCPIEFGLNRYAQNIDGQDTSRMIALSTGNKIENDAAACFTAEDEMSFAYMTQRSEFFQTFYWDSTTQLAGSKLTSFLVDPMICDKKFGSIPFLSDPLQPQADLIAPTHLAYLAHMFNYWRGSLTYRFKFAKTAFHVGRIRIMWLPGDQDPNYDPAVTYDSNSPEASYFLQQVIDLRDTNEIVFTVPFSSNRPFNICQGADLAALSHPDYGSNGTVLVQALTDLSAPSSVVQKIQCNIEISAGDDLEFAVFKGVPWYIPSGKSKCPRFKPVGLVPAGGSSLVETYGGIDTWNITQTSQPTAHVIVDNASLNVNVSNTPLNVALGASDPLHVIVDNSSVPVTIPDPVHTVVNSGSVTVSNTINAKVTELPSVTVSSAPLTHVIVDSGTVTMDASQPLTVTTNDTNPIAVVYDQAIAEEDTIVMYTTRFNDGPGGLQIKQGPVVWTYYFRGDRINRLDRTVPAYEFTANGVTYYGFCYLGQYKLGRLNNDITSLFPTSENDPLYRMPGLPSNIGGGVNNRVGIDDTPLKEQEINDLMNHSPAERVYSNWGDAFITGDYPVLNVGPNIPYSTHEQIQPNPGAGHYSKRKIDYALDAALLVSVVPELQTIPEEPQQMVLEQQSNLTVDASPQVVSEELTNNNPMDAASVSMGEKILSVRALCKIFQLNTVVDWKRDNNQNVADNWYPNGLQVNPQIMMPFCSQQAVNTSAANGMFFNGLWQGHIGQSGDYLIGNLASSHHFPDIVDAFSVCYGFWKGSLRIKLTEDNGGFATASVSYRPSSTTRAVGPRMPEAHDGNGAGTPVMPYCADRYAAEYSGSKGPFCPYLIDTSSHETFVANDVEARDLQFQIPYYQPLVMSRCAGGIQYSDSPLYSSKNSGDWYMPHNIYKVQYRHGSYGDTFSPRRVRIRYYRAVADDFRFHLLQGIPPLARTRSSRVGGVLAQGIASNTSAADYVVEDTS